MINNLSPKTILCCDDEKAICDLLAEEMEYIGYRALRCYSGNEALRLIGLNKVDLVLSDIRMPDGDGYFLLQQIRAINPKVPVVFMVTGYSDIPEETLMRSGAQAIFHKPISMEKLIEAVRTSLAE